MKLLLLIGVAAAAVPPPILELIGDQGEVRYDTGRVVQYQDAAGNVGVHIDSRTDVHGKAQALGCSKVDGLCVTSQITGLNAKIGYIKNRLDTHQSHIDKHIPGKLTDVEQKLSKRLTELE